MHPQIRMDNNLAKCPLCAMDLIPVRSGASGELADPDAIELSEEAAAPANIRVETANPRMELKPEMYADAVIKTSLKHYENEIVIPKTAILWTGKRSIVYVKLPGDAPVFKLREIELGASLGGEHIVLSGIREGEEIVTNGAFVIDASAQLEGKLSMMNMESAAGHEHAVLKKVQGLCGMCKERIEKAAKSVGASSAAWDEDAMELQLGFDPAKTSLDAIAKAIAGVGHDNERYRAEDEVYNALHGCCLYRE
jgi:Cu(I)/Ag(I) efflux system membrane fusion protein